MNRAQQCDGHKRHQSEGGLGCIIMRNTCGHFGSSACRTKTAHCPASFFFVVRMLSFRGGLHVEMTCSLVAAIAATALGIVPEKFFSSWIASQTTPLVMAGS